MFLKGRVQLFLPPLNNVRFGARNSDNKSLNVKVMNRKGKKSAQGREFKVYKERERKKGKRR